ncbi:MAG: hypothetical protein M0004_01830 [Actinomycetota bacterium]|nr:hypothetical protein [Actinomycetota bacterium]
MRTIAAPFLVARPSGASVRTRLRVSPADEAVLFALGEHLATLANKDLARRVRIGRGADAVNADRADGSSAGARRDKSERAQRKRELTAHCSSRWAGAITRASNDQYALAMRNLVADARSLRRAIAVLEGRLAAPVGERAIVQGHKVRGYATSAERFEKQRRLQVLRARVRDVEARLAAGRPQICRGGRRLANTRHHLGDAGLTLAQWQERWRAERLFLRADGEKTKRLGNETIRFDPSSGTLELRLPEALAHLANRPRSRYVLSCPVAFSYRSDEVAAQSADGAIAYGVSYDAAKRRFCLDASWTFKDEQVPSPEELAEHNLLGVDLNADHLAAFVLDRFGNPVGSPHTVSLVLEGLATSTRDARIRQAISELIAIARSSDARAIAVEDLDFTAAKATSRETLGRRKRFRRIVHGLPTGRFRARLVQMATNAGLAVVAVDPAYTSKWGARYWQGPLSRTSSSTSSTTQQITRHHAASVVIARRALGYRARRRPGVTRAQQRHGNERATGQAASCEREREARQARLEDAGHRSDRRRPARAERASSRARAPKTVRGAPEGAVLTAPS